MNREPILTVAAIVAIGGTALTLLSAFGVEFTAEQQVAISGALTVLAPFIVWGVSRQWTTPVASAEAKITEAYTANPAFDPKPTV